MIVKILRRSLLFLGVAAQTGLCLISDNQLISLAKEGCFDSALSGSLERIANNPQDGFAYLLLGKLSLDGEQSLTNLIQAEKYGNPAEAAEANFKIAQFYFAKGNYSLAISSYRKLLEKYSNSKWITQTRYWMGHACLNFGILNREYLDSAYNHFLALFRSLSRNDYYYVMALDGLGRTRMEKNELSEAQETLEMGLETAKEDQKPFLYYMAYSIAIKTGNKTGSDKWRKKLMSEFPNSLEGRKFTSQDAAQSSSANQNNVSEKGTFIIQLGAFSTRDKAMSSLQNLKKNGVESQISMKNLPSGKFFVLQSKTFTSRDSAEEYAKDILSPNGISFFIVGKN